MSITDPAELAALLAELSGVLVGFGLLFGILMGVGFYAVRGFLDLAARAFGWVADLWSRRQSEAVHSVAL